MKQWKWSITRTPLLGRSVLGVYRTMLGFRYAQRVIRDVIRWIFRSKEVGNFSYDLQERNKQHLAALVGTIACVSYSDARRYMQELESDEELRRHIREKTLASEFSHMADAHMRFGRRIGWYAFARAMKPRVIVETGIDKGLGSCVLAAALKRNAEEGAIGRLYATDIDPRAGYLLSGVYADWGEILLGDSIASLRCLNERVDLFINDSDHSAAYEADEYQVIKSKLAPGAIILGDNAHATDELLKFSLSENRLFAFFQEKPDHHWYPGAGIGISYTADHPRRGD